VSARQQIGPLRPADMSPLAYTTAIGVRARHRRSPPARSEVHRMRVAAEVRELPEHAQRVRAIADRVDEPGDLYLAR
jgi:hypothetical protein